MHLFTCVLVLVCVMRKPPACLSYGRRRDRINSVLWRSYYKGGGVGWEVILCGHNIKKEISFGTFKIACAHAKSSNTN